MSQILMRKRKTKMAKIRLRKANYRAKRRVEKARKGIRKTRINRPNRTLHAAAQMVNASFSDKLEITRINIAYLTSVL